MKGIVVCDVTPCRIVEYRGADKSLAQQGRKQATETEAFEFHTAYSLS